MFNKSIKVIVLSFSTALILSGCAKDRIAEERDDGIRQHSHRNTGSKEMETQVFLVIYTVDYGYGFYSPSNLNKVIFPIFDNDSILNEFNHFFSRENMESLIGKKIYCNCLGVYEKDGKFIFRIRKASLIVE